MERRRRDRLPLDERAMIATSTSEALIGKSDLFWNRGVEVFASSCGIRLDIAVNRLYYGMFLAVCAYACKFRGMHVEQSNPNVHQEAKALVQAIANKHVEFLSLLRPYERLRSARARADYEDCHVLPSELTPDDVIKPANGIRRMFIAAAKKEVDEFWDVEFTHLER